MVTKTYLKPTYLPTYATVVTVVTVVTEVAVVTHSFFSFKKLFSATHFFHREKIPPKKLKKKKYISIKKVEM